MPDPESPCRSPVDDGPPLAETNGPATNSSLSVATYMLLPLLGGGIGFIGYIAVALLIESRNPQSEPTMSYGQQAGLISLPICTMIAAAIGLGVALSIARRYSVSVLVLTSAGLMGTVIVSSMWTGQIARYGRDPSEIVLYYPPLAAAIVAIVVAVIIGVVATVTHVRGKLHVSKT